MTKGQLEKFLRKPNIARVATVKEDGSPFVVPVWYEWDGKYCYVVGRKKAGWVEDIRHEPRVTVLVDNSSPPYEKVIVEGTAKIIGDKLSDWVEIGKKMVKRYFGPDAGMSYLEGSIDQPRFTIKVTPNKVTSWVNPPTKEIKRNPRLAWHPRYYVQGTKWHKQYSKEKKR